MSEDFDRLRRTMSDLAENGGSTDLYDRTLYASRRLGRRRAIVSGSAVTAAVLVIGIPIALVDRHRQAAPALPVATAPSATPTAPTVTSSATPSSTAAPVRTPTSSPSTSSPSTSSPSTSSPSTSSPSADGCPVDAATLARLMRLPTGWQIDRSTVKCKQGWATAGAIPPTEAQRGDGVWLFSYSAATGKWQAKGEGSSFECAALRMPASTGFCY